MQRNSMIFHKQLMIFCEYMEDYNPTKKRRMLIVPDDMIADIESNKKS